MRKRSPSGVDVCDHLRNISYSVVDWLVGDVLVVWVDWVVVLGVWVDWVVVLGVCVVVLGVWIV